MATQAQRRAATTTALCVAARKLFARRGFDAVAVDDIAAAANVTRGAFYHHYVSKEALFEVVFDQIEATIAAGVRAAAVVHTDPLDQLREGIVRYIDLAADRRHSRIVLVDARAVLGPARYEEIERTHFLGPMMASISALRPDASAAEQALTARALQAAVCALAEHAAVNRDGRDRAVAVAHTLIAALGH